MFYKEDFSFEIGTYAASPHICTHLKQKALEQFDRFNEACKAKEIPVAGMLNYKLQDLSYVWSTNLELGQETLAVYAFDCIVPVIVIDVPLPWKDEAHHKHMAEFVHRNMERYAGMRRHNAAVNVLNQLNNISVSWLEYEAQLIKKCNNDHSAKLALRTIDAK